MIVYHGSNCIVEKPDTNFTRDNLDFGKGFYVTEIKEQADSGETIEIEVEQNIVYEEVMNNVDKALSYLLHAGYLKAGRVEGKGDTYYLSIPNKELAQIYKSILKTGLRLSRRPAPW